MVGLFARGARNPDSSESEYTPDAMVDGTAKSAPPTPFLSTMKVPRTASGGEAVSLTRSAQEFCLGGSPSTSRGTFLPGETVPGSPLAAGLTGRSEWARVVLPKDPEPVEGGTW